MWRNRSEIDRDVEEEIRFHIDMRTEANIAAGMDPRAARRDAERRFGDQIKVREAGREHLGHGLPGNKAGRSSWVESLLQDVRIAFRTLARNRVTTAAAVISLALGIGANTTVFTLVKALFLKPLAVEDPARLTAVLTTDQQNPNHD